MSDWLPETAVVTGGASGIGLALARKLAARGTRLLLVDLSGEALRQAAEELGAHTFECDVCDEAEFEEMVAEAYRVFDHVGLLLNNAGRAGPSGKPIWEIDMVEARAHFDVNFWAVWKGCAAFSPRMAEDERPSAIYNTASENAFFSAMPRMAAYVAAKHAVLGMTENLREDLPPHVHAGAIIPGWVATGIGNPEFMRHGMDPDDYAEIAIPQILARRRFVVSHYSNLDRIDERIDELRRSYEEFAERDDMDVRRTIAALRRA